MLSFTPTRVAVTPMAPIASSVAARVAIVCFDVVSITSDYKTRVTMKKKRKLKMNVN